MSEEKVPSEAVNVKLLKARGFLTFRNLKYLTLFWMLLLRPKYICIYYIIET